METQLPDDIILDHENKYNPLLMDRECFGTYSLRCFRLAQSHELNYKSWLGAWFLNRKKRKIFIPFGMLQSLSPILQFWLPDHQILFVSLRTDVDF